MKRNWTVKAFVLAGLLLASVLLVTAHSAWGAAPSAPGAPTNVQVTRGNAEVTVSWEDGAAHGSPIAAYNVYVYIGTSLVTKNISCTGSPCTIQGLKNGTTYTFKVSDQNRIGEGAQSAVSSPVIPATTPSRPRDLSIKRGNRQVTISWKAPNSSGGLPIRGYSVSSSPEVTPPTSCSNTTLLSCTYTGLTNGNTYFFSVTSSNAVGGSDPATASGTPSTTPGAPRNVSVFGANTAIDVTWNAPAFDGGAVVARYIATATSGTNSKSCKVTTLSCTIAGLTNGKRYSVKVTAQNAAGSSSSSPGISATPNTTVNCAKFVPYANLSNCDLSNRSLADLDLAHADLTQADLSNSDLRGSNLSKAKLSRSVVESARFSNARMFGVEARGVTGTPLDLPGQWIFFGGFFVGAGVDLRQANLQDSVLFGVNLEGSNLEGAQLSGVSSGGISGTPVRLPSGWKLINGYLIGPSAILSGANLYGADLSGMNLSNTVLKLALLDYADLSSSDLSLADLSECSLPHASLLRANLSGAKISNSDLHGSNLGYANLSGASFFGSNLYNSNLSYADIHLADFSYADLRSAALMGLNLSDATFFFAHFS